MPTGSICVSRAQTDSVPSSILQITGLLSFISGGRTEGQPSSYLLTAASSVLSRCTRQSDSFTSVGGGNLLMFVHSVSRSFFLTHLYRSIDRYYMQHSHTSDEYPVQAFPEGFRMLVGNPYVRFAFPFLSFSIDHSSS